MKITFLGTGAGKPSKDRNLSAIALEVENEKGWYLFDAGEATQHQILYTNLSLFSLKNIFITHLHGDHIFGLFGIITSRKLEDISTPLTIYSPKGLKDIISSAIDISIDNLGYELNFVEVYGGFEREFENFKIIVVPMIHSVECYGYLIVEKEKFKLDAKKLQEDGLAPSKDYARLKNNEVIIKDNRVYKPEDYLIKLPSQKLFIAGDNANPFFLREYIKGIDLLIHESTYTHEVKIKKEYLHSSAREVAMAASEFGIKNLILTHISSRVSNEEILQEAKEFFENVFVANDFDSFYLKDGRCQLI